MIFPLMPVPFKAEVVLRSSKEPNEDRTEK